MATGADFALVENGAAKAVFEFGPGLGAKEEKSLKGDVELFNKYLKLVTGAEIPVDGASSQNNKIRICLLPIDRLDTRFDWRIVFPSKREMRIEATTTSLFTALRQLLEEGCDARFLGTETCMFQFDGRKNVSLAVRERKNKRANYSLLRDIYGARGHKRELGLSDDGLFRYSHGIPVYAFPGDRYNAEGWPEAVMPVIKGKKLVRPGNDLYNRWQPCYSNPQAAQIAAENIRQWLRKHPGEKSVTLGQNDNGGYCECARCRQMDAGAEKSIFSNDGVNVSASYYTFANRVAESLAGEFPDLSIGLLAYTGTIMPPPFALHPSIVPVMTFDTLSAGMDEAVRRRQDDVIRRWGGKVPQTGIWDYSWGGGYLIPRVDFEGHAARIKFLHANAGRAYFGENSMPDALDGPKTYLIARLLEDVEADAEAILKEWFVRFAGPAAEAPLREIYRRCGDYWRCDEMKKSAMWPARNYIYNYPSPSQYFALTPRFTQGLAELARKVRACAVKEGEKRRAEVLLRHFERLDCVASFMGISYMSPASGELESAADAAAMLGDFAERAEDLFAAWRRVRRYFLEEPDFGGRTVYRKGDFEMVPLLAGQFAKASGFIGDPAVKNELKRIAKLSCLPPEVRGLLKNIFSQTAQNHFSNPGFAKGLDAMRIKTALPCEVVADAAFDGGKALRIRPGSPKGEANLGDKALKDVAMFVMTEDLPSGVYLVSVKARSSATASSGDLAVWRQTNGGDKDWEGFRPAKLKKGEFHVFVQTRTVNDTEDGLNIKLRVTGFGKDDVLDIGGVRILRIADAGPSKRVRQPSLKGVVARTGAVREKVLGEDAIVCRSDAYAFAHAVVDVPRILPGERLVFTVSSALPQGAANGRFGAILYSMKDGKWTPGPSLAWNRASSAKEWKEVSFGISGKDLGKKRGRYLLIFFKMKDTDAVALSRLGWKVETK